MKWNYRSINRASEVSSHGHYTDRKKGSGRPVTAMTDENLAEVEQLCQSQDDKPGTHKNQRQAARRPIIGVSRRSVQRMLKRRRLHPFKRMRTSAIMNANARHSRKTRSQVLHRRFSVDTVEKNNLHRREGFYTRSPYKPPEWPFLRKGQEIRRLSEQTLSPQKSVFEEVGG